MCAQCLYLGSLTVAASSSSSSHIESLSLSRQLSSLKWMSTYLSTCVQYKVCAAPLFKHHQDSVNIATSWYDNVHSPSPLPSARISLCFSLKPKLCSILCYIITLFLLLTHFTMDATYASEF